MITLITIGATTIDFNLPVVELAIETVRWDPILLAGFTFHKKKNSADRQQKEKELCGLHNCRMASKLQLSRLITKQVSCTRMICLIIPIQLSDFLSFVKIKL